MRRLGTVAEMRTKAAEEAKAQQSGAIEPITTDDSATPYRKLCRMRWATLIKRVYEVDPLCCPQCGGTMAIVSFIEQTDQADVIKRILTHSRLRDEYPARAPPKPAGARCAVASRFRPHFLNTTPYSRIL